MKISKNRHTQKRVRQIDEKSNNKAIFNLSTESDNTPTPPIESEPGMKSDAIDSAPSIPTRHSTPPKSKRCSKQPPHDTSSLMNNQSDTPAEHNVEIETAFDIDLIAIRELSSSTTSSKNNTITDHDNKIDSLPDLLKTKGDHNTDTNRQAVKHDDMKNKVTEYSADNPIDDEIVFEVKDIPVDHSPNAGLETAVFEVGTGAVVAETVTKHTTDSPIVSDISDNNTTAPNEPIGTVKAEYDATFDTVADFEISTDATSPSDEHSVNPLSNPLNETQQIPLNECSENIPLPKQVTPDTLLTPDDDQLPPSETMVTVDEQTDVTTVALSDKESGEREAIVQNTSDEASNDEVLFEVTIDNLQQDNAPDSEPVLKVPADIAISDTTTADTSKQEQTAVPSSDSTDKNTVTNKNEPIIIPDAASDATFDTVANFELAIDSKNAVEKYTPEPRLTTKPDTPDQLPDKATEAVTSQEHYTASTSPLVPEGQNPSPNDQSSTTTPVTIECEDQHVDETYAQKNIDDTSDDEVLFEVEIDNIDKDVRPGTTAVFEVSIDSTIPETQSETPSASSPAESSTNIGDTTTTEKNASIGEPEAEGNTSSDTVVDFEPPAELTSTHASALSSATIQKTDAISSEQPSTNETPDSTETSHEPGTAESELAVSPISDIDEEVVFEVTTSDTVNKTSPPIIETDELSAEVNIELSPANPLPISKHTTLEEEVLSVSDKNSTPIADIGEHDDLLEVDTDNQSISFTPSFWDKPQDIPPTSSPSITPDNSSNTSSEPCSDDADTESVISPSEPATGQPVGSSPENTQPPAGNFDIEERTSIESVIYNPETGYLGLTISPASPDDTSEDDEAFFEVQTSMLTDAVPSSETLSIENIVSTTQTVPLPNADAIEEIIQSDETEQAVPFPVSVEEVTTTDGAPTTSVPDDRSPECSDITSSTVTDEVLTDQTGTVPKISTSLSDEQIQSYDIQPPSILAPDAIDQDDEVSFEVTIPESSLGEDTPLFEINDYPKKDTTLPRRDVQE